MRNYQKNIVWVAAILISIVVLVYCFYLHFILGHDAVSTLVEGVTGAVILGVTAWIVIFVVMSYPTSVAVMLHVLFNSFFSIAAGITDWKMLQWLPAKFSHLDIEAEHIPLARVMVIWLLNISIAIYAALTKKYAVLENRFVLQSDASVLLREAELFKLRQQLQPHFLYNSLNSISALIMIQPEKAQDMIGKLSDFLRSSVKRETEDRIPLQEELNYIASYLAIESVRFGDRLQVVVEHQATENATMPPFLLQPLLENAIKFGLYGVTGNVKITVSISLEQSMLVFMISNPYDPTMQPRNGTGFGLGSIRRRLYLLYARNDLLETTKDEQMFTTILKIPQHV